MSNRRLFAFVDALATGRRPKRYSARAEDADVLRTAIALRAARPGEAAPTDQFVEGLFSGCPSRRLLSPHLNLARSQHAVCGPSWSLPRPRLCS